MQLEQQRQFQAELAQVNSVVAKYRGPLLEAALTLEQRLWHLLVDQDIRQVSRSLVTV